MSNSICESITDPLSKAKAKATAIYRNNPNIVAIKGPCNSKSSLKIAQVEKEVILKPKKFMKIHKEYSNTQSEIIGQ